MTRKATHVITSEYCTCPKSMVEHVRVEHSFISNNVKIIFLKGHLFWNTRHE